MRWIAAIGSFVLMQAYVQYAMSDGSCVGPTSRPEKMLFVPFMATLLWMMAVTLFTLMFAIVDDFPKRKADK